MTPEHALREDWGRYYDETFMWSPEHGVVYVRANSDELRIYMGTKDTPPINPEPGSLFPYFPIDGAYNLPGGAVFITVTKGSSMKRSLTLPLIRITWNGGAIWDDRIFSVMKMFRAHQYVPYAEAMRLIDTGEMKSVAIHSDVVLMGTSVSGRYKLYFRGKKTGILESNSFLPDYEGHPASRRLRVRLQKEGII